VAEATTALAITDDAEYRQAAEFLIDLKERIKRVDAKRKEFTQPLYDLQKKINAFFKEPLSNYEKAEKKLKGAMAAYQVRKESERKAALEEAKKAADKEDRAAFTQSMTKAADNIAPEAAGTYTVDVVKFEIEDPSKLPAEYWMPDEKKVGIVVQSLGKETKIPGVRVWVETSIRARARK
jgi:hypothetical protein